MEEFLKYLIGAISGSSVSLLVVAFLGKRWLNHQLSKGLIKYQKELEARTEILKNNLSIFAHEQTVGISRIDAQRAEAIKEIYAALVKWEFVVIMINNPLRNGFNPKDHQDRLLNFYHKSFQDLNKSMNKLTFAIVNNKIYLSKRIFECLDGVLKNVAVYSAQVDSIINHNLYGERTDKLEYIQAELLKLKEATGAAIHPIQSQLVDEFRVLLKAQ